VHASLEPRGLEVTTLKVGWRSIERVIISQRERETDNRVRRVCGGRAVIHLNQMGALQVNLRCVDVGLSSASLQKIYSIITIIFEAFLIVIALIGIFSGQWFTSSGDGM
jgi:hypothetical protein